MVYGFLYMCAPLSTWTAMTYRIRFGAWFKYKQCVQDQTDMILYANNFPKQVFPQRPKKTPIMQTAVHSLHCSIPRSPAPRPGSGPVTAQGAGYCRPPAVRSVPLGCSLWTRSLVNSPRNDSDNRSTKRAAPDRNSKVSGPQPASASRGPLAPVLS